MYLITTSIEISASPADVRQKFLDFSQMPTYSPKGFFKLIGPAVANEPLEPGLKMHNVVDTTSIYPVLVENSPTCFRWQGSLAGILKAEHRFYFKPSTITQGGTTFVHEEDFTGFAAFLFGDNIFERAVGQKESLRKGFESYNQDLKKWCEDART